MARLFRFQFDAAQCAAAASASRAGGCSIAAIRLFTAFCSFSKAHFDLAHALARYAGSALAAQADMDSRSLMSG